MSRGVPRPTHTAERALSLAIERTGASLIYQHARTLEVIWTHNLPSGWVEADLIGRTDGAFIPDGDLERIVAAKRAVIETGHGSRLEFRRGRGSKARWYAMWVDCDRHEGSEDGLVTTLLDVTDHKNTENTLRGLLREVSHRSKNLLAIIQSIATQTGRYSPSIELFLARFRGRLQSLASSQDLVTQSDWQGAMLSDLVAGQVARYCDDPRRAVRRTGIDPHLNPNAALHLGLAIHELVVNSVSHGALAEAGAHVEIDAAPRPGRDGSQGFAFTWREAAPGAGPEGRTPRFGSIALERVVPASLDGEASLAIGDGRVEYRLFVPAGNFDPF